MSLSVYVCGVEHVCGVDVWCGACMVWCMCGVDVWYVHGACVSVMGVCI